MTDQERKEIIAEVTAILEQKYIEKNENDKTKNVLSGAREKWFQTEINQFTHKTRIDEAFGDCEVKGPWTIWEVVRKLTCYVCGERYVRSLADIENADEICDRICEFIYNLRMEVKTSDGKVPEPKD